MDYLNFLILSPKVGYAMLNEYLFALFWSCFIDYDKMLIDVVQGDELKVKLNKLTSLMTQLPYTYYSLEYCKPTQIVESAENLVEVLHGHHIENSPYVVSKI